MLAFGAVFLTYAVRPSSELSLTWRLAWLAVVAFVWGVAGVWSTNIRLRNPTPVGIRVGPGGITPNGVSGDIREYRGTDPNLRIDWWRIVAEDAPPLFRPKPGRELWWHRPGPGFLLSPEAFAGLQEVAKSQGVRVTAERRGAGGYGFVELVTIRPKAGERRWSRLRDALSAAGFD